MIASFRWIFVLTATFLAAGIAGAGTVTANFQTGVDFPLIKSKFNLYNTAIPPTADFVRDSTLLYELNVESMRIEQHWGFGQHLSRTVGGTPDALTYDWTLPDHWQSLVTSANTLFHWGYDYTPYPLAATAQTPPPPDPWAKVVQATASHLNSINLPTVYHEVWNEPDLGAVFFTGTQADYHGLYANTVRNIRAIHPDAKVGGPAVAGTAWNQSFVDFVYNNNLPMDFFSFHNYGTSGIDSMHKAASAVVKYPRFHTTELVMSEYNTYTRWLIDGKQNTFAGATDLLHSFLEFLRHPELTSINWAQFQDPCACGWGGGTPDQYLGLITLDGHRKAAFNAFRIYGWMPPERKQVVVSGVGLETAASADAHRASLLILNQTGASQTVTIALNGVPFDEGTIRLYPIDSKHNSYLDGANESLAPSEVFAGVPTAGWSREVTIPNNGTLYVEAEDGTGATSSPNNQVARTIRVNRYYPSRITTSWSDFDQRTWIARLGMNNNRQAHQQVGVTAEALPAILRFEGTLDGTLAKVDANSLLGVRVDFHSGYEYVKGVLFAGPFSGQPMLYDASRTGVFPFGTKRPADRVVIVPDLSRFSVRLADFAPPNWNGRADITFQLQNAGSLVRVRWRVTGAGERAAAINCGGPALPPYAADNAYSGTGMNTRTVESPVNTAAVVHPASGAVYRSERITSETMSYTIPGLMPGRAYRLRLHFAETQWSNSRQRQMNVWINDRQMLDHFDTAAAAGGVYRAVVREFFVTAPANGRMSIRLAPVIGEAALCAIEVVETQRYPTARLDRARRAVALAAGLAVPAEGEALSLDATGEEGSANRVDMRDVVAILLDEEA